MSDPFEESQKRRRREKEKREAAEEERRKQDDEQQKIADAQAKARRLLGLGQDGPRTGTPVQGWKGKGKRPQDKKPPS